jgi:outer membrane protein assembly factor BamB
MLLAAGLTCCVTVATRVCLPIPHVIHDGPVRQPDPHLLVDQGLVFLQASDAGSLYALSAQNGVRRWQYQGDARVLGAEAGTLYSSTRDNLYALRERDGTVLWKQQFDPQQEFAALVLADGQLYLAQAAQGMPAYTLEALSTSHGTVLWRQRVAGDVPSMLHESDGVVYGAGESVHLVGGSDLLFGLVAAFRSSDGALLWRYETPTEQCCVGPQWLDAADGSVSVVFNQLYVLRGSDGSLLWQTSSLPPGRDSIALADGVVYLVAGQGVAARRASDGQQLWQYSATIPDRLALVLVNKLLYVGAQGYPSTAFTRQLTALNARDGSLLWQIALPGNSSVLPSGNLVYLLSAAGVDALSSGDGTRLWQHALDENSMVLDNGALYLGTGGFASDSPCVNSSPSTLEKLLASDGNSLWHISLDAVSTPSL